MRRRHARPALRASAAGALAVLALAAGPLVLWHDVIRDIWAVQRLDLMWLAGWTPWMLMLGGVLFFVPVAVSAGRRPDSRLFPQARNAYLGWGVTLYLLGLALAAQVARLHDGPLA